MASRAGYTFVPGLHGMRMMATTKLSTKKNAEINKRSTILALRFRKKENG